MTLDIEGFVKRLNMALREVGYLDYFYVGVFSQKEGTK